MTIGMERNLHGDGYQEVHEEGALLRKETLDWKVSVRWETPPEDET